MPPLPERRTRKECLETQPEFTSKLKVRQRLAVGLADLDSVDGDIRPQLLRRLDLKKAVHMNPDDVTEVGVAFNCDLATAACLCDILRSRNRQRGEAAIRLYVFRRRAWSKVRDDVQFLVDGPKGLKLNPSLFFDPVAPEDLVPPSTTRRLFGKSLLGGIDDGSQD